jgi:hypothetical protein
MIEFRAGTFDMDYGIMGEEDWTELSRCNRLGRDLTEQKTLQADKNEDGGNTTARSELSMIGSVPSAIQNSSAAGYDMNISAINPNSLDIR